MPKLLSSSSRLSPCDHSPAELKNAWPEKTLPPVRGTIFTLAAPTSASPSPPESVTCISVALTYRTRTPTHRRR